MTPSTRGPSRTAQGIAAARAIGLRDLHDPFAHLALSDGRRRLVRALRRTIETTPAGETVVNTLTAGLAGHAALRMDAVDRVVQTAVRAGTRQVVVVGAGFDTRAWRLDDLSGVHVVEVDLPRTQAVKQRRLADVAPMTPVVFAAADLSRDHLGQVLSPTGHDPSRPTTWVWEAVAPYLPRAAVVDTAGVLADLSAPGSRLVMTVAHPDLIGRGAVATMLSPAARGLFAGIGEPLRSTFTDEDVTAILTGAGFLDVEVTGSTDWARAAGRHPVTDPFAAERLVVART